MEKLYLVTGASGHLGSALLRLLSRQGKQVRGLILPGEAPEAFRNVEYYKGDVREPNSLRPLFENGEDRELVLFHAAGIVDITGEETAVMWQVNVEGTRNILALCREYGVSRLVYVSSVHAIPEAEKPSVQREIREFSPERVTGGYAKTKAAATQAVLEAAEDGLNAVVVHPSGILGPYESKGNHLVQMVVDYLRGVLPACVRGGYDFVDVRDVAQGCLLAAEHGRRGECYIFSNRHYDVKEVLDMVRKIAGGPRLPVLPMRLAKAFAPLFQRVAQMRRKRPLYTAYSLHALESNDRFTHDKATAELGYRPRDLWETLRDTVSWIRLKREGLR